MPNCGKLYSEHVERCPSCGLTFSEAEEKAEINAEIRARRKKKAIKIAMITAAVVIAVATCIICFFPQIDYIWTVWFY